MADSNESIPIKATVEDVRILEPGLWGIRVGLTDEQGGPIPGLLAAVIEQYPYGPPGLRGMRVADDRLSVTLLVRDEAGTRAPTPVETVKWLLHGTTGASGLAELVAESQRLAGIEADARQAIGHQLGRHL